MYLFSAEKVTESLAKAILANRSISYSTQVQAAANDEHMDMGLILNKVKNLTKASVTDNDLYLTKSILVSTNWNLNDDVFTKEEVWPVRTTASHKPTNMEHDPFQVVGHITDCWAIDSKANILADDLAMDEIPDLFHVVNGAVIYKHWPDDELQKRSDDLVASIERGAMCVSMECHFSNFDYGVITPDNEYFITARGRDTAYLTKHLRIYGGSGSFDGCKIGRVLKNITFSGKGYVENPANPYSKIFNDQPTFLFSQASAKNPFKTHGGVSINTDLNPTKENSNMLTEEQIAKLQADLAAATKKIDELQIAQSQVKVDELKVQVESLTKAKADAEKAVVDAQAEAKAAKEDAEKSQKDKEAADKAKADAETQLNEVKARETKANRISTLVDGGFAKDEAEAKVTAFSTLSDELFTVVATELVASKKQAAAASTPAPKTEEAPITEDSAAAGADPKVIENAKPKTEGVATTTPETQASEAAEARQKVRASLSNAFASLVPGAEPEKTE